MSGGEGGRGGIGCLGQTATADALAFSWTWKVREKKQTDQQKTDEKGFGGGDGGRLEGTG